MVEQNHLETNLVDLITVGVFTVEQNNVEPNLVDLITVGLFGVEPNLVDINPVEHIIVEEHNLGQIMFEDLILEESYDCQ